MKNVQINKVDEILVPHNQFDQAKKRLLQQIEFAIGSVEPVCLALIGESRTGKSRLLETIEAQYPKQRLDDGLYVPVLRISAPSKPTVKGLVETLLCALGDRMWFKRGSENEKTERLLTLLINQRTHTMIIDEFQHFFDKSSRKVQHHLSDWLKILVDRAKITLLVGGLQSCMAVINQNEQLSGRFYGAIYLSRLDWNLPQDRSQFAAILHGFQKSLTEYSFPPLTSDEMVFRFYCATGGLVGYVAKIFRQACVNAQESGDKAVHLHDLAIAYTEAIWQDERKPQRNPFDADFNKTEIPIWLAHAKQVGTAEFDLEPEPPKTSRKSSKRGNNDTTSFRI